MGSLKQLASQTVWYGASNIAARFFTYLLTPYLTTMLSGDKGQVVFGQQGLLYAIFPFMNVLYTYGMETSYFRFSTTEDKRQLYNTQATSLLITTVIFTALLWVFRYPIADFTELGTHVEYVGWCAAIIGFDAMSALPYARLRKENRPRKYAFTKILGIVAFVGSIVFLFSFGEKLAVNYPNSFFADFYNKHWGIGFILFANMLQAIITFLLLSSELLGIRLSIDKKLFKKVLVYSLPILIAGFAGTINDSLNRVMFKMLYKAPTEDTLRQLGMFTATIRLAVLINLAIQAFRLAAEPFFFSVSKEKNAKETYARVMRWFVIIMAFMFLNVTLFLDIWKHFIAEEYRVALDLVPVLLGSYIFFGMYTNLTIWYKLTDKTYYGTYIMLIGSVVTIGINWMLIPTWGYVACAWGMLLCNIVMVGFSYFWGQRNYPVPYEVRTIGKYLGVMLLLFGLQTALSKYLLPDNAILRLSTGLVLFFLYGLFILKQERKELKSFPVIGKYIK